MKKHLQHLQNHLKVGEVIPCRYGEFGGIDNKHDFYRGEDCTEKFYESLREHTMKTIDFQKKKMIPLTSKEYESCLNQTNSHLHICTTRSICNSKYSISKEIPVAFHNGYNYNNYFIIKEVAKEFEEEFNSLGKNAEKYKTFFSLNIKKKKKKKKKKKSGN